MEQDRDAGTKTVPWSQKKKNNWRIPNPPHGVADTSEIQHRFQDSKMGREDFRLHEKIGQKQVIGCMRAGSMGQMTGLNIRRLLQIARYQ